MGETSETLTLRDYLGVLREHHRLIIVITLLAIGAAVAYAVVREPRYEASATVAFKQPSEDLSAVTGTGGAISFTPAQDAAANARVVTRDDVVRRVQESLGTSLTPDQLRARVTSEAQPDSNLVEIAAEDSTAQGAADIANAFARKTRVSARARDRKAYRDGAERVRDQLANVDDPTAERSYRTVLTRLVTLSEIADPVQINRPADPPGSPASPQPLRDALLAGILGLLLGIGAAFLRDSLESKVKTAEDLEEAMGMPILGQVPESLLLALHGNALQDPTSAEAEAFRTIRANLRYFQAGHRDVRSVLITSISPEDGKSTVALSLASAAAGAGARTLLIEADLRNPSLARRVGFNANGGLSSVLVGDGALYDNRQHIPLVHRAGDGHLPGVGLDVLLAGLIPPNPAGLIESPRMDQLLAEAERDYDMIVIDSPPLPLVSDAIPLVDRVAGVIVVARLGYATREDARKLGDRLRHLEAPILGVVANFAPPPDPEYYQYIYGHELSRT